MWASVTPHMDPQFLMRKIVNNDWFTDLDPGKVSFSEIQVISKVMGTLWSHATIRKVLNSSNQTCHTALLEAMWLALERDQKFATIP